MLLNNLSNWLISPSTKLTNESDIRRAKYLSALLIPLIVLTPFGANTTVNPIEQQAVTFLFFASTIAYIFSRTQYFLYAGIFATISIILPPYAILYTLQEYTQLTVLTALSWFNLFLLMGSLWLPLMYIFIIWLTNLIFLLTVPIFMIEALNYGLLSIGFLQLLLFGSIILLSARLRNIDENALVSKTVAMKQARDEAKLSNKVKSIFLSNMSHEFRTPLHGILSFAEFGLQGIGNLSEKDLRKYILRIKTSAERLKLLVEGLLDLTELESGKLLLKFEESSLSSIIKASINDNESRFVEKNQIVKFDFDDNIPLIECDRKRIKQVLMNILDNASIYSPEGSEITITTRLAELVPGSNLEAIEIKVSDQGKGIDEAEVSKIFLDFYQGKDNNFSTGNYGIGLALSSRLVSSHKGKIWCSNNPDTGSSFYFSLPLKQEVKA